MPLVFVDIVTMVAAVANVNTRKSSIANTSCFKSERLIRIGWVLRAAKETHEYCNERFGDVIRWEVFLVVFRVIGLYLPIGLSFDDFNLVSLFWPQLR